MHQLFYAQPRDNNTILLPTEEAHHALSVLRAKPGDELFVTDGVGAIFTCIIESIDKKACVAAIARKETVLKQTPQLDMYIGLPRRDAFEAAIQMLVPFGVHSIRPVACMHSQRAWWKKKWQKLSERFGRLMIASLKQSLSAYLPEIHAPVTFEQALGHIDSAAVYADMAGQRAASLAGIAAQTKTLSCFIGPPGGFGKEERAMLTGKGAHALWLSPLRLRTELAAAAAAAALVQMS